MLKALQIGGLGALVADVAAASHELVQLSRDWQKSEKAFSELKV
jgi:hypothetical protein